MNRTVKNIIMILVLVVMTGLTIFTIYLKNNTSSSQAFPQMEMTERMGEPPEKPDGENDQMTPPEMPEGEKSQSGNWPERPSGGNSQSGNRPEHPTGDKGEEPPEMNEQGDNQMGKPPEMPEGGMESPMEMSTTTPIYFYFLFGIEGLIISLTVVYLIMSQMNKKTLKETLQTTDKKVIFGLLTVILTAVVTVVSPMIKLGNNNSNNNMQMNQGKNTNIAYSSATEITSNENITKGTYTSEKADENAILVTGDVTSTLENITVSKTGDSDGGDTTSFYGTNSAILAKGGANVTIKNATIETDANGANGVFSYGGSATTNNSSSDGTTITISDSKITTKKNNSGGIMTTGGGTTIAKNLTITTEGTSSAAIRSDRGGGTVEVDGGSYTTNGQGSPTIYSTADITVKNATLNATSSEGIVIEGKNKVTLENVELTDNNTTLNGQSTTYKNIFLYQSMSGDAAKGSSEFVSKNSTITTKKGDSFYVTNTSAIITLENNKIINEDNTGNFLRIQKDSWGTSGKNGGEVTLKLKNQTVEGNIVVDEISTLDMTLSSKSNFTGTINKDNTASSLILTLDKTSKITLTGDSYVTELNVEDETYSNINFNGYKLYVNGKAINE